MLIIHMILLLYRTSSGRSISFSLEVCLNAATNLHKCLCNLWHNALLPPSLPELGISLKIFYYIILNRMLIYFSLDLKLTTTFFFLISPFVYICSIHVWAMLGAAKRKSIHPLQRNPTLSKELWWNEGCRGNHHRLRHSFLFKTMAWSGLVK